jgi:hypothetical protein
MAAQNISWQPTLMPLSNPQMATQNTSWQYPFQMVKERQLQLQQEQAMAMGFRSFEDMREVLKNISIPVKLSELSNVEGSAMTAVKEREPQAKLEPKPVKATNETCLKEYAELAAQVGIAPPDLTIETFKQFLNKHDLPVFNLQEVIAYMDDKAKKESKDQAGWQWHPLRQKDRLNVVFGTNSHWITTNKLRPASDYYHPNTVGTYDKIIPLHALKKVALIEKEFKQPVAFFVCGYAPLPALNPDPFLMAVINNPRLASGEGRFIVDFWSEPGFGLMSQLA